mmetsp:Transcript_4685/g.9451  ORF Transcript_4685/g.9451 Transcript_4685/m.9451 type:complete len:148 (-) Transcript_4685:100-543(-)
MREDLKVVLECVNRNSDLISRLRASTEITPQALQNRGLKIAELGLSEKEPTPIEELLQSLLTKARNMDRLRDADSVNENSAKTKRTRAPPDAGAKLPDVPLGVKAKPLKPKAVEALVKRPMTNQTLRLDEKEEDQVRELDDISHFFD